MDNRGRSIAGIAMVLAGVTILPMRSPAAAERGGPSESQTAPYEPTDHYDVRHIEGWTVVVSKGLLARQADLADRALERLRFQLYQITARVPAGPLSALRRVRIWVEENESHTPCMAYHPDAGWLRDHDMNPEKARCVELANVRNFLRWTREQPWMVLHELSHAYHHQFLDGGFNNAAIEGCFERAKTARLYDSVLRYGGKEERAYALSNAKEFFAEASEAFFGTNDFYPFVRPELRQHDAATFALLRRLWRDE